ncbi:PilW family protein [Shewanella baltica]|uniref:PilW family protein n=1 Tax=Shewanella baltica TaxID=62322 RepID=UPI00217D2F5D|nr:PilW family protein [Shewanella baltica]MCS6181182.1 pilus assembly protein PilW [Shewanella baltica]MCS6257404.1 pilus assembly protein PilW [Shewanella baltica]
MANSKNCHKGMSLVELMVSMVIGLFLTLGLFAMFSMSSSNVITTSQFNQLQENGRIALSLMERDISQLGFMGDITGTDFVLGTNMTLRDGIANDCIGAGVNNGTLPNAEPAHFRRLWGYEEGKSGDTLSCLSGVNQNTDVIQIKRLVGPPVTNPDGERFYMAATSSEAVMFKGGNPPNPVLENARFWEYQHHVYFIKNDGSVPVLRRKTLTKNNGMNNEEQLVEGIENMRILYGFDSNGDDTADSFMPAENVTTLMWDNELFQRLVALRVFLLVRAIDEDKSYTNETTYTLGDKEIKNLNDHYRRKIVSTTMVLANPVLIRN